MAVVSTLIDNASCIMLSLLSMPVGAMVVSRRALLPVEGCILTTLFLVPEVESAADIDVAAPLCRGNASACSCKILIYSIAMIVYI